jgi:hypothetical protein
MKCRSASAADIKQEYRSTRARGARVWLKKEVNAAAPLFALNNRGALSTFL